MFYLIWQSCLNLGFWSCWAKAFYSRRDKIFLRAFRNFCKCYKLHLYKILLNLFSIPTSTGLIKGSTAILGAGYALVLKFSSQTCSFTCNFLCSCCKSSEFFKWYYNDIGIFSPGARLVKEIHYLLSLNLRWGSCKMWICKEFKMLSETFKTRCKWQNLVFHWKIFPKTNFVCTNMKSCFHLLLVKNEK